MNTLFDDVMDRSGPTPRSPRHTLFFGLLPPIGVARRAHDLAEGLLQSGEASGALRPERVLHISMLLVGKEKEAPPPSGLIEALRAGARTVKQRPFAVSLNRVEAWGRSGGKGAVVALGDDGVIGVEALQRRLAQALGEPEPRNFNPHMTLLYGAGPSAPLPVTPIGWTVRDFALIHSLAGQTRYEVLSRFPLST